MIHHLKIYPRYFKEVTLGNKTAEYRKNDRNFQVGDTLILEEYDFLNGGYTECTVEVEVTHIITGGQLGIPEDYCVMSINL